MFKVAVQYLLGVEGEREKGEGRLMIGGEGR
jgi:hypothetical protein